LQISWLLSVLLMGTILLNFLVSYGQLLSQLYRYLRRCYQRRQKKQLRDTNNIDGSSITRVIRLQPEKRRINESIN
jgi:hypothetical protein